MTIKVIQEGIEDVVLDNERLVRLSTQLAKKIKEEAKKEHRGLWYQTDYELSNHVLGEVHKFRCMVCEEVAKT